MPEIIKTDRGPLIHIHFIERVVSGRGVAVKVYGKMKVAAKEYVYAQDLGLKTIEVLLLTPDTGTHTGYMAQHWIYNRGEYGNYASIDVFDADGVEVTAGRGPADGSIWLDFIAMGE